MDLLWNTDRNILLGNHQNSKKTINEATQKAVKVGGEIGNSSDPVEAAFKIAGKFGIEAALSRLSASQCAGLIGVIVSSIAPQVYFY